MNKLPKPYRLDEEIANAITHGLGTFMAIIALVFLVAHAAVSAPIGQKNYYIASFCIFGFSMIFLYLTSTLYHSLLKTRAYPVFERLDHSAIYILIAGTYTAYCLTALRNTVGWWIFGLIWGLAAIGIALYVIFGSKLRVISVFTYIFMGWIIVLAAKPLQANISNLSWKLLICSQKNSMDTSCLAFVCHWRNDIAFLLGFIQLLIVITTGLRIYCFLWKT